MKTLEEVKKEYAWEQGYSGWFELSQSIPRVEACDIVVDQIAERYATECAKEALRLASDKDKLSNIVYDAVEERQTLCSKGIAEDISENILSESNLPKHK